MNQSHEKREIDQFYSTRLERPGISLDTMKPDHPISWAQKIAHATMISRGTQADELQEKPNALKAFGVKLGAIRRRQELDLDELAKKAKVDPEILLEIELGIASFEQVADHVERIEAALGDRSARLSKILLELMLIP